MKTVLSITAQTELDLAARAEHRFVPGNPSAPAGVEELAHWIELLAARLKTLRVGLDYLRGREQRTLQRLTLQLEHVLESLSEPDNPNEQHLQAYMASRGCSDLFDAAHARQDRPQRAAGEGGPAGADIRFPSTSGPQRPQE